MSDSEDNDYISKGKYKRLPIKKRKTDDPLSEDDDDDEDEEEEDEDDEREDDEEGDSEEDEYDDEEEEEERPKHKAKKKKPGSAFILDEAEVDDDEEDENIDEADEDFDELNVDNYIVNDKKEKGPNARQVDRELHKNNDRRSDFIEDLASRYLGNARVRQDVPDMENLDEALRQPTSDDPSLWSVRCRKGEEAKTMFLLTRKCLFSGKDFQVTSVIIPEGLSEYLYVEAKKEIHVRELINGVGALSFKDNKIKILKVEEMLQVLQKTKNTLKLKPGDFVRIKKGTFREDLAEVVYFDAPMKTVEVKLLPRIDYTRWRGGQRNDDSLKRKMFARPPMKPFSEDDVNAFGGTHRIEGGFCIFKGNRYKDGFLYKVFTTDEVVSQGIKPNVLELERFGRDILSMRESDSTQELNVGDNVEVVNNALAGTLGKIIKKEGDLITILPNLEGINEVTFTNSELRKYFAVADHVKVVNGLNKGDTGTVVKSENNIVIFISDINRNELKAFPRDLTLSDDYAYSNDPSGRLLIGDLVHIDPQTVGVVVGIVSDSYKVLDMHGKTRSAKPISLSKVTNHHKTMAKDSTDNSIEQKSMVKVIQGFNNGVEGQIAHIFKGFVFLHSLTHNENSGYFVSRPKFLAKPQASRLESDIPNIATFNDFKLPPTRPSHHHNNNRGRGGHFNRGGGNNGGRKRSDLIGKNVKILQGQYKTLTGFVKDVVDTTARVQLSTDGKVISFDVARLAVIGSTTPSSGSFSRNNSSQRQSSFGSRTPMYGSQTPMYGSQTPMYGSQTPMYGSQTPMYGDGSRTPYQDNMTHHSEYGSMTPGRSSSWDPRGGSTPLRLNESVDYEPFTPRNVSHLSDDED